MNNGEKITSKTKKQLQIIQIIIIFLMAVIVCRIGYLQFARGYELSTKASRQQTKDKIISSKRGIIYDRNRKVLALSASVDTVTATPSEVDDNKLDEICSNLAQILEMDAGEIIEKLTAKTSYIVIKAKITPEQSEKIRSLNYSGIYLTEDSKRYYPYGNFASHIIGFVGTDNQGLNGIEMVYDKYLKGVPGRVITAKDSTGSDMPYQYERYINAENGLNVVLTIDETIQHFAEKHLEDAIKQYDVRNGAACIIMNAKTGEILAMATKPDYNLNSPFTLNNQKDIELINSLTGEERNRALSDARNKMWRNKAVVDTYEPGSTYKTFVAAAALEDNAVSLSSEFDCKGYLNVANYNISCHKTDGHGHLSFAQGVKSSCNPVFMQVGANLGKSRFMRYHKLFGFTSTTGFDLPGEAEGVFFADSKFNVTELATSSFGQGFQVTPLQLISAMTAITNDGIMLKPHIVKELVDDEGNVVKAFEKQEVRRVISAETAKTVRDLLETVVSEGTAKNAYIKGYRVAGKTGTSEKFPRNQGLYVASFLGFAPANDPEIIGLVVLDEPMGAMHMGGQIAAPTFQKIFDDTLRYLNIDPQYTETEENEIEISAPNVVDRSVKEASEILAGARLKFKIVGNTTEDDAKILRQVPKGGTVLPVGSTIMLYTSDTTDATVMIPSVVGKSVTEANTILTNVGLNMKISDTSNSTTDSKSYIGAQSPASGEIVAPGTIIIVDIMNSDVH